MCKAKIARYLQVDVLVHPLQDRSVAGKVEEKDIASQQKPHKKAREEETDRIMGGDP